MSSFLEFIMPRQRKTRDVFVIQGHYGCGWEDVCEEDTRRLGREQLKCYNDNEPNAHRLVTRRERIEAIEATEGPLV